MPSILAIISKAVFEKDHGRGAAAGGVLPLAAYHSKHAALAPLAEGGDLYLVTVRDGALWLVGVLRRPRFARGSWLAPKNVVPIADITAALRRLRFASGKGIDVPPEKLGMALQTPRALTDADVAAIEEVRVGRRSSSAPVTEAPMNARTPVETALSRAIDAAEAGTFDGALAAVLDAWRAFPTPVLAERVERVSARSAPPAPATTSAAWIKLARRARPGDLDPLLVTFFECTVKEAIERAELLASWPADPRLDLFLARTFEAVPYRSTSARPFWVRLMRRQPLLHDPRVLPILDRCRAACGDDYAERYLAELIDRLLRDRARLEANARLSLPRSAVSLLERLDAALGDRSKTSLGQSDSGEALLERVFARPEEDEVRHVLGDVLAQRGDVRGELIALQFQSEKAPLTVAQRRREASIIDESFAHLVGPLAPVVLKKGAHFRKGFLSACLVKTTNPRHVEAVATSPWWATVEHIEGPGRLFFQSVMRSLRSISMAIVDAGSGTRESVVELCKRGLPKLEQLQCAIDEEDSTGAKLDALLETRMLPALTALAVTLEPHDVARLFASSLAARLAHLRIRLAVPPPPAWTGVLDPLRWRASAEILGLSSFEMDLGDRNLRRSTRFSFTRGSRGKLSQVHIELDVDGGWLATTLPHLVDVLRRSSQADVESLAIQTRQRTNPGPPLDTLEKAAKRLGGSVDVRSGHRAPSVFY